MLSLNYRDSMGGGNRNRIIYELHSGGYLKWVPYRNVWN